MLNKRIIILLILLISFTIPTEAQKMLGYVEVKGNVKDGLRAVSNANIEIYAKNTLLKIEKTNITGNFEFILELNRVYMIRFTREFYVTKMIQFNTNVRENELGIWFFEFIVDLFPQVEGLDFSFLKNEPVGKISYNSQFGEFEHDAAYTKRMHKKIEALKANYNAKRNKAYEQTVKKADQYASKGQSIKAINLYRKAAVLDRSNEYPNEQALKIDKHLRENMEGYNRYVSLLQNGDSLFSQHKFRQARFHYNLVLDIIKGSAYAKYMVNKINKLLPKFDPSYLRLQKYRHFLSKADKLASKVRYKEAINYYNKALSIQKGDSYALKQISFLQSQLAKKTSKNVKKEKYKEYIKLGDRYYENKSLSASRIAYLKALEISPNKKYPQIQIEKIDRVLYPDKTQKSGQDFPGFSEQKRDQSFLNKLVQNYPPGRTIEYYDMPGKKIKRIIMVENNYATEYLEVRYDYGTFFFRNGQNISRAIFISETSK